MNLCPGDQVGPCNVKMEALHNRRHGARRRRFKVDDAVYVKDYRGQKCPWKLASSYAAPETLRTAVKICYGTATLIS
ncbi:hypothetical protein Y032_0041g401 [Ancylostoma ceylanicum]|uniref:Uncharacterized protein n=1 Tax=Ancylostoma ceylanicum TaxID=53326 RepID=A0A016UFV6_9BILA|nr:hypothetical protein Y032_0041g401 [Ancylostoma ceylanicum]